MADRKAKTITVKFPCTASVNDVKTALKKENEEIALTCIQDLGAGEFLIEFEKKEDCDDYLDSGVDFHDIHLNCNPPHGYHINVSILGLRAYVDDDKVIEALSEYGEVKSEVIRLKYRTDHDLAGLENGNRLVRMVLTKVSVPYSLRIDGQWCRIIHNNQSLQKQKTVVMRGILLPLLSPMGRPLLPPLPLIPLPLSLLVLPPLALTPRPPALLPLTLLTPVLLPPTPLHLILLRKTLVILLILPR